MVNLKEIVERCNEINSDRKAIEKEMRSKAINSAYDEKGLIKGTWFKFEFAYAFYYFPRKILTNSDISDIEKKRWDINKILESHGY